MKTCECCGQDIAPNLSIEEYERRAKPRLAAIDVLSGRIDFGRMGWEYTQEGERWKRLMDEQARDEMDAGL